MQVSDADQGTHAGWGPEVFILIGILRLLLLQVKQSMRQKHSIIPSLIRPAFGTFPFVVIWEESY
ncbi:hypothetical protein BOW05_04060 [Solemya velum gill symbiont]|nr:hypothetical protein BOW05_04060 [Solemya velum gill symbiont]